MAATLNQQAVLKEMHTLNLKLHVNQKMRERNLNTRNLSTLMGRSHNFLTRALSRKDADVSFLITLSNYLQHNLLEPYVNLLPEDIRVTAREKELMQQLEATKQQVQTLEKERDLYKEIALKTK